MIAFHWLKKSSSDMHAVNFTRFSLLVDLFIFTAVIQRHFFVFLTDITHEMQSIRAVSSYAWLNNLTTHS